MEKISLIWIIFLVTLAVGIITSLQIVRGIYDDSEDNSVVSYYSSVVDGGVLLDGDDTIQTAYDNCDPVDVAEKCCKVVKSKAQCKNYCDQRAGACKWTFEQKGTCKTDVDSKCPNL